MSQYPIASRAADSLPECESIADLIARLGSPPKVVVDDWREQLIEMLVLETGRTLTLSATHFGVDTENRLIPLGPTREHAAGGRAAGEHAAGEAQVRETIRSTTAGGWDDLPSHSRSALRNFLMDVGAADVAPPVTRPIPLPPPPRKAKPIAKSSRTKTRRLILGGAALATLAVAAKVVSPNPDVDHPHSPSQREDPPRSSIAATSTPTADDPRASRAFDHRLDSGKNSADEPPRADALQNLEVLEEPQAVDVEREAEALRELLTLPSTLPPVAPPPEEPPPGEPPARSEPRADAMAEDADPADTTPVDALPADAATAGVRVRAGQSVALPPSDVADASVTLVDHAISEVAIEFPTEHSLATIVPDGPNRWSLVAGRNETDAQPLARILATSTETRFSWSESAPAATVTRQIANGRLRIGSAAGRRLIYLRPIVEIDPLPFRFDDLDQRTAWPLGHAADPTTTRLEITFDLPAEVQFAWIEPPAAQSPRRMRAVAQLMLASDEFTSLRIRLDVQAGLRLTYRQRTAVRLDSTLPWQLVSLPALTQWTDQMIASQGQRQQALQQVLALYSQADYQQRKQLRPRRDQLQQQVDAIAMAIDRLSKRIQLMQWLQADGAIRLELATVWPDGTQPVLTTAEPPPPDAPGTGPAEVAK